jgi:hypothetical protein
VAIATTGLTTPTESAFRAHLLIQRWFILMGTNAGFSGFTLQQG